MRHVFPRLALLAAGALSCLSAQAHRPWLLPSTTLADGQAPVVSIDAAISEDLFEFDSFPLALDTLRVTAPDGSAVAPDARTEARRRVSFDLKLAQKGTYRIAGVTDTVMRRRSVSRTRLYTQKNDATRVPRVTGCTRCRLLDGYSTRSPAGSLTSCVP